MIWLVATFDCVRAHTLTYTHLVWQTKWIAVLLNHGVNPGTNESVLPCSVLVETLGSRHVVLLEPNDYIEEPNLMGWRDTMYFYGYDDDIVSNIVSATSTCSRY